MKILNKIKKALGHRYENRYTWGEFYWGGRDLSIRYTGGDAYTHNLFIFSIPFLFKSYIYTSDEQKDCDCNAQGWSYGFYVYNWHDDIVLEWGKYHYRVEFPWMLKWQKTEILDFDFNVLSTTTKNDKKVYDNGGKYDQQEIIKNKIAKSYGYTYTLKSGSVQHRIATIKCIEKWTWGWKWFPWKKYVRTSIEVQFNEEVGERSGSWKGGCIGCSYDLSPGETPEQCLRRMEKDRKFN